MKSYEIIERNDLQIWNGREINHKSYYCHGGFSNDDKAAVRFYDLAKAEKKCQELQATAEDGTTFRLVTRYADERRISMDRLNVREQIGKIIRNARKSKNMTQAELADKTGLSIQHIENVERYAFAPRVDILNRLCKVLEIEITLPLK